VSAVNIQENNQRCPINYITPPGVRREQLFNNNTIINQNEQSLSLRVSVKDWNLEIQQFSKCKY
jgi:cell surface protein SprA